MARDVLTSLVFIMPSRTKNTDSVINVVQRFVGDERVVRVLSDNAGELIASARYRCTMHEASQQRTPHTNGIFERAVHGLLTGTRTLVAAVGLPDYFWCYAALSYTNVNICQIHLKFWVSQHGAAGLVPNYRGNLFPLVRQ